MGIFGSEGESGDSYEIPESTPESQGYRNSSLFSIQEQLDLHNSNPDTPTIQSGEGPSIETWHYTDILIVYLYGDISTYFYLFLSITSSVYYLI